MTRAEIEKEAGEQDRLIAVEVEEIKEKLRELDKLAKEIPTQRFALLKRLGRLEIGMK